MNHQVWVKIWCIKDGFDDVLLESYNSLFRVGDVVLPGPLHIFDKQEDEKQEIFYCPPPVLTIF